MSPTNDRTGMYFPTIILFLLLAVGCSGGDFKGEKTLSATEKNDDSKKSVIEPKSTGADVGKLDCKNGEANKGASQDKANPCSTTAVVSPATVATAAIPVVAGPIVTAPIVDENKKIAESTTCNPGSADLSTYTAETNNEKDLHVVSVLLPFEKDKPIKVIVKKRTKPVIILLYSGSEAGDLKWDITAEDGANISSVFIRNTENVNGIDFGKRMPFTTFAFNYAWQYPSADAIKLVGDAQIAVGVGLKKFQGCKISQKFVID